MSTGKAAINMATGEISFRHSDFAVIVFPSMPETYPTDAHIECLYTITSEYKPTKRDWVGLYKVGWTSSNNYLYYEWSASLNNYEEGKDFEGHILFPAHQMPGDDGEFYQFCYVASTGQVKGASTPFQFKKPRADDFIEMLDDENDMLVIHSKTFVLEENLKKAQIEKKDLTETLVECRERMFSLDTKISQQEKEIAEEQKSKMAVTDDLRRACIKIEETEKELSDSSTNVEQLLSDLESVNKENLTLKDQLDKQTQEIASLNENIKSLLNEKDAAAGKCKLLEEEKEMYKSQLSNRERSVFETQEETEKLRQNLKDMTLIRDRYEQELVAVQRKAQSKDPLLLSKKEEITRLREKLRNSEDKLSAAESTKDMLQKELSAYEVTLTKMSADLEAARGEPITLKAQLDKITKDFEDFKAHKTEEIDKLTEESDSLKKEADSLIHPQSIYCLQKVLETLQERYGKLLKQNEEISLRNKELTNDVAALKTEIRERENDLQGWQLRVTKCSEEYKKLYSENQKNIKKVEKLKSTKSAFPEKISDNSYNANVESEDATSGNTTTPVTNTNTTEVLEKQLLHYKNKAEHFKGLHHDCEKKMVNQRKTYSDEISDLEQKLAAKEKHHNKSSSKSISKSKKLSTLKMPQIPRTTSVYAFGNGVMLEHDSPLLYGNPYTSPTPQEYKPPSYHDHIVIPSDKRATTTTISSSSATTKSKTQKSSAKNLPTPIEPTVLPSAKAAAVKAASKDKSVLKLEAYLLGPSESTTAGTKFLYREVSIGDTLTSGDLRICPKCDEAFPKDVSESVFSEHIANHFGRMCPMCMKITDDDVPQDIYESHVYECIKKQCN